MTVNIIWLRKWVDLASFSKTKSTSFDTLHSFNMLQLREHAFELFVFHEAELTPPRKKEKKQKLNNTFVTLLAAYFSSPNQYSHSIFFGKKIMVNIDLFIIQTTTDHSFEFIKIVFSTRCRSNMDDDKSRLNILSKTYCHYPVRIWITKYFEIRKTTMPQ